MRDKRTFAHKSHLKLLAANEIKRVIRKYFAVLLINHILFALYVIPIQWQKNFNARLLLTFEFLSKKKENL